MEKPIIEVKNLGKRYLIGERQPYLALRDNLAEFIKKPLKIFKNHELAHPGQNEFWALKEINFEVNRGDTLGIIGRNGAGKSTLLKILSQITPPTTGKIHLRGRIASLLEIGTGFHPELTGRENIYLNGALLGMKKWEIKQKFDQIVEFSDISEFLDTPVKRYSSGMYVRLAFSVAAHLEPDILVVDEVLAVGDAEFQKKCLGKMEEVTSKEGRTIIFVSHNMNAIQVLCKKCILLQKGKLTKYDTTNDVINTYISNTKDDKFRFHWINKQNKIYNQYFNPMEIYIQDSNHKIINSPISNDKPIHVCINADISKINDNLTIGYALYDEYEKLLYWSYQTDTATDKWPKLTIGNNKIYSQIPAHLLNEGTYRIELIGGLHKTEWLFRPLDNVPQIQLEIKGGLSDSPLWINKRDGCLAPVIQWKKF